MFHKYAGETLDTLKRAIYVRDTTAKSMFEAPCFKSCTLLHKQVLQHWSWFQFGNSVLGCGWTQGDDYLKHAFSMGYGF
ncbi:hypothetical protein IGI04_003508 [Brassica rapa subsp. trilocularis]|uniref:Uncharacterized protein n=1 Tax=Brassica rapa subsp. trilocularis TaxID=1813537 RepID=A0ABQ7P0N1_BRACM|nr:hypothetical protein IGI04_003508 [Brassica rapa subsp. trilocularis]